MQGAVDDLVMVKEFLNTLDERTFNRHGTAHAVADRLTTVEALQGWLAGHDLLGPDEEPDLADLGVARSLRTALRGSLVDLRSVATSLAAFPLRLTPTGSSELRLRAATGTSGLDAIVETVATGAADGRWNRLKLCASDDCRWAFYDTSRSGSGRWCSMETCGNRHKTRTYRQRRTAPAGIPPDEAVHTP